MTRRGCSAPDCDNPHQARGWCDKHYRRWKRGADPLRERPTVCVIDNCDDPIAGRGLCNRHWKRWRLHGDPLHEQSRGEQFCKIPGCGKPHLARGWCPMHYSRWRTTGSTEPPASSAHQESFLRTCRKCGQTKLLRSGFHRKKGGWNLECKDCCCAAQREYNRTHKQQRREYLQETQERRREIQRQWRQALRVTVLKAYGSSCACCGETDLAFLTIDHVNNDGAEHRRQIAEEGGGSSAIYRWLQRHGYPPGFQVLCWNCNAAKEFNPGGCPHQPLRIAAS